MRLRDLFSDDALIDPQAEAAVVTGLAVDSRAVKPGDLFFALAGSKTDGARFIDAAIASGAVAVAGDRAPQGVSRVPFVTTPNPRRALALAAARFYPRQPATIAAVTGTSGKTSVAAFTRQIWQRLGHDAASIGTIGLVSPKRTIYGSLTTPDPIALHRQLDEIAAEGVTHLALEASSHGPSPTCRAITWITILTSRIISPPSCGCFAIWSRPTGLRSSRRTMIARRP
jgi:UDP-N-acetylmuramoyl-L-alanyl-D-glutamate--2,6-diaminopimelate ligase